MVSKSKRGRRNRSEWKNMTARELTGLMSHRIARIEILKLEIEDLQGLIRKKKRAS